jgi:hypothetical protein
MISSEIVAMSAICGALKNLSGSFFATRSLSLANTVLSVLSMLDLPQHTSL